MAVLTFAVFWNVVSAPLWLVLPGEIIDKGNRVALLGLLFPAIGLLLVCGPSSRSSAGGSSANRSSRWPPCRASSAASLPA